MVPIYPTGLLDIAPGDMPQQSYYQPPQPPQQQGGLFGNFDLSSPESFLSSLSSPEAQQQFNLLSSGLQLQGMGYIPGTMGFNSLINQTTPQGGFPPWMNGWHSSNY